MKWFKAESVHSGLALVFRGEYGIKGLGYWYIIQQMMSETDTDMPTADHIRIWTGCGVETSKKIQTILENSKRVQNSLNDSKRVQKILNAFDDPSNPTLPIKEEENRENRLDIKEKDIKEKTSGASAPFAPSQFFDKEIQKLSDETVLKAEFERFKAIWPERRAWKKAFESFKNARTVKNVGLQALLEAVPLYVNYVNSVNTSRTDNLLAFCAPEVWLNQERWDNDYRTMADSVKPRAQGTKLPDRSKYHNGIVDYKALRKANAGNIKADEPGFTPTESG
jgi:uncharacterized protein YktA (UPF0223 family)